MHNSEQRFKTNFNFVINFSHAQNDCFVRSNWSGRQTMQSWVGASIFGTQAVIYSTRIKLHELFDFACQTGATL